MHSFLLASLVVIASPVEDKDILKVLSNAYSANIDKFQACKAAFAFKEGAAASLDAAKKGDFEKPIESVGEYIFKLDNKRYELLYKEDDIIKCTTVINDHETSSSIYPIKLLTDGKRTLIDNINLTPREKTIKHRVQIIDRVDPFLQYFRFPLNLGFPQFRDTSLSMDLDDAISGSKIIKSYVVNSETLPERKGGYKVRLNVEGGSRTYWVDPEKGGIPIEILDQVQNDKEYAVILHDDIREIKDGGYLPFLVTRYNFFTKKANQLRIHSFQIIKDPASADFKVSFPEPVTVIDTTRSKRLNGRKEFSLIDVMSPSAKASSPIRITTSAPPVSRPVMPGERAPTWNSTALVLLGTSLGIVLLVAYRIYNRRGGN